MSSYQNKETLVVNQNLISAKQPFETISLNTTTFVRNLKDKGRLQRNQITERSRKKELDSKFVVRSIALRVSSAVPHSLIQAQLLRENSSGISQSTR